MSLSRIDNQSEASLISQQIHNYDSMDWWPCLEGIFLVIIYGFIAIEFLINLLK